MRLRIENETKGSPDLISTSQVKNVFERSKMFTIKNFKKKINPIILQRGTDYYNNHKVSKIDEVEPGRFLATVKGTQDYEVNISIDGAGMITEASCDCPFAYGPLCKHIVASLLAIEEKNVSDRVSELSSSDTLSLIRAYEKSAAAGHNSAMSDGEKVKIVPDLHYTGGRLEYSLKIGRDRLYKVRDIKKLFFDFRNETKRSYGKYLEFVHTVDAIDSKSKELLEFSMTAIVNGEYYSWSSDTVYLDELFIDNFFDMFRDEYVLFDDRQVLVKFDDPKIAFRIINEKNKRFKLTLNRYFTILGRGIHACFYNGQDDVLWLASPEFTRAVCDLFEILQRNTRLFISKNDMPAFYSAVLKRVSEYAEINGIELIDDYIPPEPVAQLYVDCSDDNIIYGKLMFNYGDNIYSAFSDDNNPHYDKVFEAAAQNDVKRYFSFVEGDEHHPLVIDNDDNAYELISNGLNELSKSMELYISDRFRRMAVRPPVKAQLGVRPQGGLLELDIEDQNYSPEELVEVLNAYRAGVKYHRMKDGSFTLIDDALSELNELVKNLNITDKDMLKKNLHIPAYRMLYLDSLRSNKSFNLQRSAEFKKAVKNYHVGIEDADNFTVPQELSDIMRDYQKYGFRWLKTLAAYKFGGILADDMGLGKTIQAISLMLDQKNNSDEHRTNLIVCPSSLTLNWESEAARFAPQLKTLTVIGTAAARDTLIQKISSENYDAVITSYSTLTRDIDKYENLHFSIQFIDEAQYIKNHNTQAAKAVKGIHSDIRFALTGTPVENSLAELWSIFDFIMPGYLFGYQHFKNTFEVPIVTQKDDNSIKALQNNVSPFILRRMKKDVLLELPDKTETVLTAPMEGEQHKLYTANAAKIQKSLKKGFGDKKNDRIEILAMLTRLRQICCDPHLVYENYSGKSAKLEQCMELVESCVNAEHKILLFSQFTSMLDIISERLTEMNISFYMLTGSTKPKERIRLVNEFNENDVKVFLISLKAGGTGLNLTGADIVIHYDPWWNSSAENQASDRAYRIGQKRNVQVYKLIAHKSIEENILKLQQSKADLNDIAAGGTADITRMSADEIIKILE